MVHKDDASIAPCCLPIKSQLPKGALSPSCINTTCALVRACQDKTGPFGIKTTDHLPPSKSRALVRITAKRT